MASVLAFCPHESLIPIAGPFALQVLNYDHAEVEAVAALRTVGLCIAADEQLGTQLVAGGLLAAVRKELNAGRHKTRMLSLWVLCNVVANTEEDATSFMGDHQLFYMAMQLTRSPIYAERKESLHLLANLIHALKGTPDKIRQLLSMSEVEAQLRSFLVNSDHVSLTMLALHSIDDLFTSIPELKEDFEKTGGLDCLEDLQLHHDEQVNEQALDLAKRHFGCVEEVSMQAVGTFSI